MWLAAIGVAGLALIACGAGDVKETFNAEAEAKENASPLSTQTVPAYSTTPDPVGVSATAEPTAATLTPPPTPTPTPEICDGLGHCWRYGAWRFPDDRAWIPTPVPVVTPIAEAARGPDNGVTSSPPASCPPIIANTFGWPGCAISFCESGWDPNAAGDSGLAWGYFQIRSDFHPDATFDPAGNIAAAWRISGGGTDWGQWSTRGVLYSGVCPNDVAVPGG